MDEHYVRRLAIIMEIWQQDKTLPDAATRLIAAEWALGKIEAILKEAQEAQDGA